MKPNSEDFASLTDEQRIIACAREIFLPRQVTMEVIESYKSLLRLPRMSYNSGMSIKARAGQGKSTIGAWIAKQSCTPNSDWPGKVIYIDLVRNVANLDLTKLMLMEVGLQFHPDHRPLNKSCRDLAMAERLIRENKVWGVFIDEAPMLLALSSKRLEIELGAIKGFSGVNWAMNVCLSGDPEQLEKLFSGDATISSRFNLRSANLPPLKCNKSFYAFVLGFVGLMPLKQASIIDKTFCKKLLELSKRTVMTDAMKEEYSPLRTIVEILREASMLAIVSGDEHLNCESLQRAFDVLQHKVDRPAYVSKYSVIGE